MAITIEVNGVDYDGFTHVEITLDIERASNQFNISTTSNDDSVYPLKAGDSVKIKVDGSTKVNGFIDDIIVRYSKNTHSITATGRDSTCDFIDSSLPSDIDFDGPISLKSMFDITLDKMGLSHLSVTSNVDIDDFQDNEIFSASVGMNAFSFIESYAKKRQVIIGNDGNGGFILQRGSPEQLKTQLINETGNPNGKNNILNGSGNFGLSKRYNKYIFHSQQNPSSSKFAFAPKTITEPVSSSEVDSLVRDGRTLIQYLEEAGTSEDCQKRARWEANIRRAKSTKSILKIAGHSGYDGENFSVNKQIRVFDDFLDIDSNMLITGIKYIAQVSGSGVSEGNTTTFSLAPSDAYQIQTNQPVQKRVKSKNANKYMFLTGE